MASSVPSASSGSAQYYMGCKISLISKSDIRYEGILYSLDAEASTVALSSVRSFGTEDRRPENPIAARDQTYEYILFRGSDIKDIVVCEPPRPELFGRRPESQQLTDPAILEVTTQGIAPAASQNPLGALTANRHSSMGHSLPTASSLHSQNHAGAIGVVHVPPMLYSNTAAPSARQPPAHRPQANVSRHDDKDSADDVHHTTYRPQRRSESYKDEEDGYGNRHREENRGYRGGYGVENDRYSGRAGGYSGEASTRGGRYVTGQGYGNRGGAGSDYTSRGGYQSRGGFQSRGGYNGENRGYQQRQGYNARPFQQNTTANQQGVATAAHTQTKESLPEYDFETAEKVFHELESQAKKLSLIDSKESTDNGDSKQQDNMSSEPTKFYDSANSFFDKISCEALEKEKNPSQRPDWGRERLMNRETFGTTGNPTRSFSNQNQGRGGYRGSNNRGNYGGYQQRDNYDNGSNRYDDYNRGDSRPRGGMRYSNNAYPSRNFGPSQQRDAQTGGGGRRPEDYFRCPDTAMRRRLDRAVYFDDEWTSHDDSYYGQRSSDPQREQSGGRRRKRLDHSSGNRQQQQGSNQPRKQQPSASDAVGSVSNQDHPRRNRRSFRGQNRGAPLAEVAEVESGQMATAVSGPAQRKRRAPRKKDEWVQYDLPTNCKGLITLDAKGADSVDSPGSGAKSVTGDSKDTASLIALLDGKDMPATKTSDWLVESGTTSGEMGQTGNQLEVESHHGGIMGESF